LGFETYWFDNNDDIAGFDFSHCLFLTEGQVDSKIPLNPSSFYVLHHADLRKYIEMGCNYINLCNYGNGCRLGESWYYPGCTVEKLTYYSYFDRENRALYQPWGTDLMPEDFPLLPQAFNRSARKVYYVGSITSDNAEMVESFGDSCRDHGTKFVVKTDVSDIAARRLMLKSRIAPDIRCQHHVNVGYIPCRIFKNISYGTIPATNSAYCRDFFERALPYSNDCYGLYDANIEYNMDTHNEEASRWLMNEVRTHHTYLTRATTIANLAREL
jgi:hypothetical protein